MESVGHRADYIEPGGCDFVIAVNSMYLFPEYPMPWVICFVLLWLFFFFFYLGDSFPWEMELGGSGGAYF